jgi:hypothetical protein
MKPNGNYENLGRVRHWSAPYEPTVTSSKYEDRYLYGPKGEILVVISPRRIGFQIDKRN